MPDELEPKDGQEDGVPYIQLTIDEDQIWGCRIGEDLIKIYLSEWEAVTFTEPAAKALLRALIQAMEKEEEEAI